MKKVLIFLLFMLSSLSGGFAFSVLDETNSQRDYFSDQNSHIFIESSVGNNFSISYTYNQQQRTEYLNLSDCGVLKCANFTLNSLLNPLESYSTSHEFNIVIGSESKKIYLDLEKPLFNLLSWNISKENRFVDFNYNSSDNFNKIKTFELYRKEGSNLIFLSSILGSTNYKYLFSQEGEINFLFKISDEAGNIKEFEKSVLIEDFIVPHINKEDFILNNGNLEFDFEISDENLLRYEIKQGSVTFSEDLNSKVFSKKLQIQTSDSEIVFKVFDSKNNSIEKKYSPKSPIQNVFSKTYINTQNYQLTSNSDSCSLVNFDGFESSKVMTKDGDDFSFSFNINQNKEVSFTFFCVKGNFKEYFEHKFIYDVEKPSLNAISIEKLGDGTLNVKWTESIDNQGKVVYELYRDSKLIYTGSQLSFIDTDVSYPESYSYYVKSIDLAKNFVESQGIMAVPNKITLEFRAEIPENSVVENSKYSFKLNLDSSSLVKVDLKNRGKITETKSILNSSLSEIITLNLTNGVNEILIYVKDSFGNSKSQSYFVTYKTPEPVVVQTSVPTTSVQDNKVVESSSPSQQNNNQLEKEVSSTVTESKIMQDSEEDNLEINSEEDNFYFWILLIIVLILLIILILKKEYLESKILEIRENNKSKNRLKENSKNKSITKRVSEDNNKNNKKRKYSHAPEEKISRENDLILNRALGKIKKERELRNEEKKKLELKRKKEALKGNKVSDFQKNKLEELHNRKEKLNSEELFANKSNSFKDRKSSPQVDEKLREIKKNEKKGINFTSIFKKKEKITEKKDNEMLDYLNKKRTPSWDSNKEYREKISETNDENLTENVETSVKENHSKVSLDDYLNKRLDKRKSYFAEKEVDKDLEK